MKKIQVNIVKIYSIFIAFLPIIATYSSGVAGLNLADIILVVFFALSIYDRSKKNIIVNKQKNIWMYILLFYIVIFFLLLNLTNDNRVFIDSLTRTIRMCFYIISVIWTSKTYLDISITKKWIIRICFVATIYIFIQTIAYNFFGIILKGYLSFLPIYQNEYTILDYGYIYSTLFYRPTSFFLEPAMYSQYVFIGLIISLFDENIKVKTAIFITIGILLSTSAQGIIVILICWGIYLVKNLVKQKKKTKKIILMIILMFLPIGMYYVYKSDFMQTSIGRIYNGREDGTDAYTGRLGGFKAYNNLNFLNKLIGNGYGVVPEDTWMSSGAYMLYDTGIIGFGITILIFVSLFIKEKVIYKKVTDIVFGILFFAAFIFNTYMFVYYFSVIMYNDKLDRDGD